LFGARFLLSPHIFNNQYGPRLLAFQPTVLIWEIAPAATTPGPAQANLFPFTGIDRLQPIA
jgi:hypothetical protein